MRKRRKFVAIVALCAIALAACGSSTSSAQKAENALKDAQKAAQTGKGSSEFEALLKKADNASYKVTYKTSSNNNTFTIAHVPNKLAYTTGDTTLITNGSEAVSCANVGKPTVQCTKLLSSNGITAGSITQGFFGAMAALLSGSAASSLLGVTNTSDQTIAGRSAQCAEIKGGVVASVTGTLKTCVDKDTGVLLLGEATNSKGTSTTIEATAFGDASASDFTPPAKPQNPSNILNGGSTTTQG